ncbi:MAG TPA: hypothetical protein VFX02_02820 [Gammaproteobacteria bacterium]|nr:hypothetical protein [Gammaproteobacteria bacterium]
MRLPTFSRAEAILWGGLAAGVLDIGMVFAIWAAKGVMPSGILQAIASSVMGLAAYEPANAQIAMPLGMVLHFFVSYVFAAAYVLAADRVPLLKTRPVPCGLGYGVIAYLAMTLVVVPLSRANFGPPADVWQLAQSLFVHLALFGLPIALAASRVR